MGQRSLCSRDKVGAIIVDAENRIVDSGYNGPPRGFKSVTGAGDDLVAMGLDCGHWCSRAIMARQYRKIPHPGYEDCPALHAEANALMFSDRSRRVGGSIYVSSGTCGGCAKLVANSGVARAVYASNGAPHRNSGKWYDFIRDCGVEVVIFEPARS